jgi:hypothetical protein
MATTNDITGDAIQTGAVTNEYRNGHSTIFGESKFERRLREERERQNMSKEDAIAEDEAFQEIQKRNNG